MADLFVYETSHPAWDDPRIWQSGTPFPVGGPISSVQAANVEAIAGTVAENVTGAIASCQEPSVATVTGAIILSATIASVQEPNVCTIQASEILSGVIASVQEANAALIQAAQEHSGSIGSTQEPNEGAIVGDLSVAGDIGSCQEANEAAITVDLTLVAEVVAQESPTTGWAHRSLWDQAIAREKRRREEEEIMLIIRAFLEIQVNRRWVA